MTDVSDHQPVSRRSFLAGSAKTIMGVAAMEGYSSASGFGASAQDKLTGEPADVFGRIKVGMRFNESEVFADAATGQPARRLTRFRRYNQQPTYHLNACFSADSRFLVLATRFANGATALLRAEVATGELTVLATLAKQEGQKAFDGNNTSLIQASNWVAAQIGSLRLYHLHTFEERVLIKTAGEGCKFGHPIGSIDGKKVFIPRLGPARLIEGVEVNPATHLEVNIETGEVRELFKEDKAQCNHVVPCPANPDLLLIDRDWPPRFSHGGDNGKTSRVWLLNHRTKVLTEIRPQDANRFQIHSNWNFRGDHVYYHGRSGGSATKADPGHYIGVTRQDGAIAWEGHYPKFYYGHVSSHTRKNAIITDGLLSPDKITAIYWDERGADGLPRTKVVGQHNTEWISGSQYSHPHCHVSPDGKWISYNRATQDRSDVCVVQLDD